MLAFSVQRGRSVSAYRHIGVSASAEPIGVLAFGVRHQDQKAPQIRTFVFFVTFCSNSLRSLLFHRSRPAFNLRRFGFLAPWLLGSLAPA
jgi:hypothetical protein